MIRDCKLIAEYKGIKFKFNFTFNKDIELDAWCFVAEEDNFKSYYIDNIFNLFQKMA